MLTSHQETGPKPLDQLALGGGIPYPYKTSLAFCTDSGWCGECILGVKFALDGSRHFDVFTMSWFGNYNVQREGSIDEFEHNEGQRLVSNQVGVSGQRRSSDQNHDVTPIANVEGGPPLRGDKPQEKE